jgi:hypothetical protein
MNYREWLVYRARLHTETATEPEVLRYVSWRNHQALREWNRRADAAHVSHASKDKPAERPRI